MKICLDERRNTPAAETRRISQCPGYSGPAIREGYRRGDGTQSDPGGLVPQGLVRSGEVEVIPELVESPLLGGHVRPGWPGGLPLQGPVHPFVGAVLLRARGLDPLVADSEPHPPGVELTQPVDADRGEGGAVVAPDGQGHPDLAKPTDPLGIRALPPPAGVSARGSALELWTAQRGRLFVEAKDNVPDWAAVLIAAEGILAVARTARRSWRTLSKWIGARTG